jgi:glycosyltransferase involved in cell wall biosynthesis
MKNLLKSGEEGMRIALVTTEFVTEPLFDGGLANYLLRLVLSLRQLGHSPVVFVTSDHHEVFKFRGTEVHRVEATFKELPSVFSLFLINKFYRSFLYLRMSYRMNAYLRKIHGQKPFDVVQYTHLMGLGLFRHRDIPSVIRLSAYTPYWHDAYELKNLYRQQGFWEALAMRRADGIFGPSKLVCSILAGKLKQSIELIESPFILDTECNDPNVYESNLKGKRYLLFFGTVGLMKGAGTIAKALKSILRRYPNLHFVFVGKDHATPDGRSFVSQLYEEAGEFGHRVSYLGRLRHEELYPVIQHAVAVVLPSRIDNLSNACIEAMAHRKVVIGTVGTSFEQLIDDGRNGFLCEVDNEKSLLAAIDKVMNLSSVEVDEVGERAWERIQQLDPDIVVKQLIDYYSKIVIMKQKRRALE